MSTIDNAGRSPNLEEDKMANEWLEFLPAIAAELMPRPTFWDVDIQEPQGDPQESPSFADCVTNCRGNLSPQKGREPTENSLAYQLATSLLDSSIFIMDDAEPHLDNKRIEHCPHLEKIKQDAPSPMARFVPEFGFDDDPSEVEKAYAKIPIDDAGDGYNWRKYGQKHVKETNCPRSYYRCTFPGCTAKKQIEKNHDGTIADVIRKGKHNHPSKGSQLIEQAESLRLCSEWRVNQHSRESWKYEDPHLHKRSKSSRGCEENECWSFLACQKSSFDAGVQRIVRTETEQNVIDDGYRWRKYGQKLVKGSTYPRSYYRCTTSGCKVRKHTERSKDDPKVLVTTYDGVHNHPMQNKQSRILDCSQRVPKREQEAMADFSKSLPNSGKKSSDLKGPVQSAVDMAEDYLFEAEGCGYLQKHAIPQNTSSLNLPPSISIPEERYTPFLTGSKMYSLWSPMQGKDWMPGESIDALAILREPLTPVS